uniref:Uncharacterized protein n=1 Tax=Spongospora subterranea TaxID=70186 RepID=A0A0H5R6Q0_9EUKA|eukprot:CRZ09790.1 hypothetical protein [Spongospora subterranea]
MAVLSDTVPKYAQPGEANAFTFAELEPWSPHFARLVTQIEHARSLVTQIRMLEDIKTQLEARGFSYRNDHDWVTGATCCLRIGNILIDVLQKSFGVKRDLLSDLLIRICERSELRLFCHSGAVKLAKPVFPLYFSLLIRFWAYVKQQILKPADTRTRHQFCLRSLSILYLRLPQARCIILEAFVLYTCAQLSPVDASLIKEFDESRTSPRYHLRQSQASVYTLLQHPPEWELNISTSLTDATMTDVVITDAQAIVGLRKFASQEPHTYYLAFVNELFRQLDLNVVGAGPTIYCLLDSYTIIARQALLAFISLQAQLNFRPPHIQRFQLIDVAGFAKPDDLLSLCIRSVLNATPVYDRARVNTCLDMIDTLINAWASEDPMLEDSENAECHRFPAMFCFEELQIALNILLQSEDFQVLIKTLCFIHSHLSRYNTQRRQYIVQVLLFETYFFKLFLHWHRLVRESFHAILVFKIRRGSSRVVHSRPPETISQKGFFASIIGFFAKSLSGSSESHYKEEDYSQSLNSPETSLERVMRLTKERDATKLLDVCNLVLIRCRCNPDEEAADTVLWMNALVYVKMIADGPTKEMKYAKVAIEEFSQMQKKAQELQSQHFPPLRPFEIVTPMLVYDIKTVLNDAI